MRMLLQGLRARASDDADQALADRQAADEPPYADRLAALAAAPAEPAPARVTAALPASAELARAAVVLAAGTPE
jgi:hypothetical protein